MRCFPLHCMVIELLYAYLLWQPLFLLVYGMEVVLPFEVEIHSLIILVELGSEEAEWAQARFDQLNLIEGKRLAAMSHGRLYQSRVKNAFDKRVHLRKFNEGSLF